MNAIVPDTLQGAIIVSVIDFFLSFIIISGIGVVLSMFPLLNRVTQFFGGTPPSSTETDHGSKVSDRKNENNTAYNKKSSAQAQGDDIAAIAAAVSVVMDGVPHRIIDIEHSQHHTAAWVAGGRIAHHGSHTPRG